MSDFLFLFVTLTAPSIIGGPVFMITIWLSETKEKQPHLTQFAAFVDEAYRIQNEAKRP